MSQKIKAKVWKSGDWKNTPLKKAPYNGIKISAVENYDSKNKFVSVNLTFKDYSLSPNGCTSVLPELTIAEQWVAIPIPVIPTSPPSSPPDTKNPNFTINGKVMLESTTTGIFVRIHLHYGLEHYQREELGFILKLDSTLKPSS